MVDHEPLLKKLGVYGFVNMELKWCQSNLTRSKQVVHLGGKESSEAPMKHRVPQGSILRPTILHTIHQRSTIACQFTSRPLC